MLAGVYDGLYMTHEESGHDEWKEQKEHFKNRDRRGKTDKSEGVSSGGTPSGGSKIALTEKMKTALYTDFGFNEIMYKALMAKAQEN